MIAQAIHETGNFTSNVFRNNLNAFGYKRFARSPYQVKDGFKSPEGNNYAAYNDVADSSREVADWIGRRKTKGFATVKTPVEFAKRLKENAYFTDREDVYANALQKHFNSLV